ncbi:MAG: 50S ribosomal protein L10 [Candidatus Omnitrophica bacterium]|nr:50S ribosomal protein L10 [Candidatus Omnitrophota bacterium]
MKRVGQVYREKLIKEITDNLGKNKSVFLMSYSKLSGPKIDQLRKSLNKKGADVYVSKNSVARIALKEAEYVDLADKVSDQTAFIWTNSDSVEVSKVLINFIKGIQTVNIRGGVVEGRVIASDDVKKLSDLPSREVLLSMLLGTIQAPLTRFAGALNAKTRDLLSILKQLSEKKGGS